MIASDSTKKKSAKQWWTNRMVARSPLQPERMSIPITCQFTAAFQRKDMLFYVLFGSNTDYIRRMIEESVLNIAREYPSDGVAEALQLIRPCESDSLQTLRIRFFLLLNEDETMRKNLADLRSNIMVGLCPFKAERFYDDLCDELIPMWIKDFHVSLDVFVERLRDVYLCS